MDYGLQCLLFSSQWDSVTSTLTPNLALCSMLLITNLYVSTLVSKISQGKIIILPCNKKISLMATIVHDF